MRICENSWNNVGLSRLLTHLNPDASVPNALRTGRREERSVSLQSHHIFPRQMTQLERSAAGVNTLTYVPPMLRFQEVIFDKRNPSSGRLGVTLQVHARKGPDAGEGWRF